MRNEVGQEATEEMSAFKGVVNLFIVVVLYVWQRGACFQQPSDKEREATHSTEVLS